MPKAYVDTTNYKYPIGPAQTKEFQKLGKLSENVNPYGLEGNTNYREDDRALKLIAQDQWEVTNALDLTSSTHIRRCSARAERAAGLRHSRPGQGDGQRERLLRAGSEDEQLHQVHTQTHCSQTLAHTVVIFLAGVWYRTRLATCR